MFDAAASTIRFLDAANGAELAVHAVNRAPDIVRGGMPVGPDDVLYISTRGIAGPPGFAAYALSNGTYEEVARVERDTGDSPVTLGAYGLTAAGVADPIMPYVGIDGAPSGATLDIAPLSWNLDRDTLRIRRGDLSWTVTCLANSCLASPGGSTTCASAQPAPGDSVVLTNYPYSGGTPVATRLTLLQPAPIFWDTDWHMIGIVGDSLVLTRDTDGQLEIATFKTT